MLENVSDEIQPGSAEEPKRKGKVFRTVFVGLLYFFAISIGSLFGFFLSYLNRLPQIQQIENYQPNIPTHVYAADGTAIDEFYVEKRVILRSIDQVSPDLRNAIIAVEDAHYFEHPGVDPWGILRAFYVNIRTGRVVEGGSTITQQLAKMLFLRPERTMERKLLEAMLAVQLERKYTKQELFLFYCNQVYLGHGVYGVEAAAHYYFAKPASQLNVVESAMIAALPKAPQDFSPHVHPAKALQRRNHVLKRMLEEKFITSAVYDQSVKTHLGVMPPLPKTYVAPYFTEEIRKYLETKYGYAGIYESGLEIHSTLDLEMQKAADHALDRGVRRLDKKQGWRALQTKLSAEQIKAYRDPEWNTEMYPGKIVKGIAVDVSDRLATIRIGEEDVPLLPDGWAWTHRKSATDLLAPGNLTDFKIQEVLDGKITAISLDQVPLVDGALIAMDIKTGKIRALIGGSDFITKKFDRATQAYRQTGSAFKPFIYAAAFERGYTPSDVMIDAPISYYDPWTKETWSPQNYTGDFLGPMTLRRALELSRNTVAVKLLEQIGVKYAIQYIDRFDAIKNMQPYLPLALGASESTLINMVRAYGAFGNQGLMMEPVYIEKILDRSGNTLEQNMPHAKEVMRADIAYLLTDVLQGVIKRGTAVKAKSLNRPIAGKTGTTDDCTDAWFIGYTPSLIVGVWVGFDEKKSLGKKETGAEAALPIWIDFMKEILKDKPVEEFQATSNIITVAIDRHTGLRATPDCTDVIIESFIAGSEPRQMCGPEHHGQAIPLQPEEEEASEEHKEAQTQQ